MESNPDFAKKRDTTAPLTEADVAKAVSHGLTLVSQAQTVAALLEEDSFVEVTDAERASLDFIIAAFSKMNEEAATGSKAL